MTPRSTHVARRASPRRRGIGGWSLMTIMVVVALTAVVVASACRLIQASMLLARPAAADNRLIEQVLPRLQREAFDASEAVLTDPSTLELRDDRGVTRWVLTEDGLEHHAGSTDRDPKNIDAWPLPGSDAAFATLGPHLILRWSDDDTTHRLALPRPLPASTGGHE